MLQNQPATRTVLILAMSPNLPKTLPPFLPTMVACLVVFLKVVTCLSNQSMIPTMACKLKVVNMPVCLECLNINAALSRFHQVTFEDEEQNVVS
jgi:hypothetical protein